tara:strand:+ start:2876 stop:3772 length:897 start_codon:yes stop_codon:yes gene_type:complete
MIYNNLPFAKYLKLPGLNASKLKPYSISPRFGYYKEHKEFETSEAMTTGTLVHSYVLEGAEATKKMIKDNYITSGFPINKSTGKPYGQDSKKFKDWHTEQGNKEIVTEIQLAHVKKITRAVTSHSKSKGILALSPNRETAITWTCEYTGMPCKAMVDFNGGIIAGDLKTFGKQLTRNSIEREILDRQYHLQFSFYQDGLIANGINIQEFYAIFVQSKDDYDVGCFRINDATMDKGRNDYIKAIYNYQKATDDQSEFKDGLFPEIESIGIPSYHLNRDDEIDYEEKLIIEQMLGEVCAK